jgi:hypothetical protein
MTLDAPNLFCIGVYALVVAIGIIQVAILIRDGIEIRRMRK